MRRLLLAAGCAAALCVSLAIPARASHPDGYWLLRGKMAVRIWTCGGKLCGEVVWLDNPALRTPALCGRTIIWDLTPSGPADWNGGQLFDPENGTTYDLTASLQSADRIIARVFLGLAVFGETRTLTRIAPHSLAGWC
jgi:uncharacterized protein (DUF2147 family)